jgi:anti-anti-sigma factor
MEHVVEISIRNVGGHAVVDLHGNIDFFSINNLKKVISSLISEKKSSIVLDLRDVGYIDSAGLGLILTTYKVTARYKGKIGLLNVRDDIFILLKLAAADSLIKMYKSETDLPQL